MSTQSESIAAQGADMIATVQDLRAKLATETARRERAERLIREFCQENPTRWTRLELIEVRDELVAALKHVIAAVETNGVLGLVTHSKLLAAAREAIAAAESHASCIPPE